MPACVFPAPRARCAAGSRSPAPAAGRPRPETPRQNANPCRDEVAAALPEAAQVVVVPHGITMITENGPTDMTVDYVLPDRMHQKVTVVGPTVTHGSDPDRQPGLVQRGRRAGASAEGYHDQLLIADVGQRADRADGRRQVQLQGPRAGRWQGRAVLQARR